MNSRRRFVLNGSLATAALLAAKPFELLASAVSDFQRITGSVSKLSLLHTSTPDRAAALIRKFKKGNGSILLNMGSNTGATTFDITLDRMENDLSDHIIIERQGVRTGIIRAQKNTANLVERVNRLAAFLKKEKDCQAVVCISELGYRSATGTDDLKLAASSTELDIIIGINEDNHSRQPVIAANKVQGEVIIQSSVSKNCVLGNIEIRFDAMGKKNGVLVANAA